MKEIHRFFLFCSKAREESLENNIVEEEAASIGLACWLSSYEWEGGRVKTSGQSLRNPCLVLFMLQQ